MVPFYAPHTPFNYYPQRDAEPYTGSEFSCFPSTTMNEAQNSVLAQHHGKKDSKLAYSALVSGMDYNVGRVLGKLQSMGVRDNTLVIFTADQGWNAGHHGVWGKGNGTVPYNMYEESIRVPMIWNQPPKLKPSTVDAMISSYDLFPTILDYLSVAAPPKDVKRVGTSYASFLKGKGPSEWRDRLYFEYAYVRAVRTRTLKYIERVREWPSELYDLETDPGETRNVLRDPAYADRLRTLQSGLHNFFNGIGAPPLSDWKTTTKQNLPERYRAIKGPAD
jgi:arylsulfatase A-like enzyme